MFGNTSVERLFKYVSFLLYGVYVLFMLLAFTHFGDRIVAGFALDVPATGWALGGLTYASYNIIGAIVILPVLRHLTSDRDAVVAGLIAGPLAMLPALLFFTCMVAFYPGIAQRNAAVGFHAAAPRPAAVPPAVPADDLLRAARKRHRRRARDQRAHRQGLAERARRSADASRTPRHRTRCCSCAACCSPTASASSR